MFCSPPGRASAQLGPGRVKILRLAFQVTTASQQKKHPLFVFTSAPPATGQLLSRLITQPLAWLDVLGHSARLRTLHPSGDEVGCDATKNPATLSRCACGRKAPTPQRFG